MNACPKCGAVGSYDSAFCAKCGTPLSGAPAPQAPGLQPVGFSATQDVQYPVQYPGAQTTNGLAVASVVLGSLWIFGLGSLAAVIMGHTAQVQIRQRNQKGQGTALAGLVLGYLGIAGTVVVIILIRTLWKTVSHVQGDIFSKVDITNAARYEEIYRAQFDTYTSSITDLQRAGYEPNERTSLAIAASGPEAFCIVASSRGIAFGNGHWLLYDSRAGGLSSTNHDDMASAEAECSLGPSAFARSG